MASGGNNNNPNIQTVQAASTAINTPSVFEKAAGEKFKKFNDWENSAGPHDITAAPGMGDLLDIYGSADSLQQQKRMDVPGKALSGGAAGGYQAQLDAGRQMQQYDERAAGLSHGLQSVKNEAYGMGGDAATLEAERKNNYYQSTLGSYDAYKRYHKSGWDKAMDVAGLVIGGARAFKPGGYA